jgi:Na+/proline symporter
MVLARLDQGIVLAYLALTITVGVWVTRRAGRSSSEFFLSGRSMPWWLLGLSMVATTFSTDTPNLVTDLVRTHGVSGNWVWWAFLVTGMLTTFVYARLWRRSGALTDLEFYELRYSGRAAAFLRGFRAFYLGVFFNVMIMAAVTLAAIKIGGVLFGLSPGQTVLAASAATVVFSAAGGLRGVVLTDALLFFTAMLGSALAAWYTLAHPAVGGLSGLLGHTAVQSRLALVPDLTDPAAAIPLFFVPLAVQWWAAWYPGAEPGGGGYVAQRMLAARDERHALAATLAFNVAHYAIRPWPWILVALASLVVYPDLASIAAAFPDVDAQVLGEDLGYSAMLTFLPHGALGIVVASLAAAYMSTISTHLNWGSSYVVHDLYHRFVRPNADETELVAVGRAATVALMALAALVALRLESAYQAFQILLQIGAGTGLLFLLRWFWWRINAWCEIVAMSVSFVVAVALSFGPDLGLQSWQEMVLGVAVTTAAWLIAAWLGPSTDGEVLARFAETIRPGGPGWRSIAAAGSGDASGGTEWPVPRGLLATLLGTFAVYVALFGIGFVLYGEHLAAGAAFAITGVCAGSTWRLRPRQDVDARFSATSKGS